jgi:hypothetical protein
MTPNLVAGAGEDHTEFGLSFSALIKLKITDLPKVQRNRKIYTY